MNNKVKESVTLDKLVTEILGDQTRLHIDQHLVSSDDPHLQAENQPRIFFCLTKQRAYYAVAGSMTKKRILTITITIVVSLSVFGHDLLQMLMNFLH